MIYVGIDPGLKGGLASINEKGYGEYVISMPDSFELAVILTRWHEEIRIKHLFLEKAQPMPKQGVTSMFNYGHHNGVIEGILKVLGIPYSLIPPKQWQKEMFIGTKATDEPKKRALAAANRIFPKQKFLASLRCKKPHDGMIDSLLLAEYCRRKII